MATRFTDVPPYRYKPAKGGGHQRGPAVDKGGAGRSSPTTGPGTKLSSADGLKPQKSGGVFGSKF